MDRMATFYLLLAVVILASPRGCRCDEAPDSIYRSRWYAGVADWPIRTGGSDYEWNNLIPVTKLPRPVADSLAVDGPPSPDGGIGREVLLLGRYRKYVADNFFRYDDVCSVYEWLRHQDGGGEEATVPGDSMEVAPGAPNRWLGNEAIGEKSKQSPDEWQPANDGLHVGHANFSCLKGAKEYYICLYARLNDEPLTNVINRYLTTLCDPDLAQKRNAPKYVSKQKFYSWGGKRSASYQLGGKRIFGSTHKQPKVVIRNPFHSWGGKRSEPGSLPPY